VGGSDGRIKEVFFCSASDLGILMVRVFGF